MTAPRDLIPMALFALATLVGVGVAMFLGELLRRFVLFLISALVPAPGPAEAPRSAADDDSEQHSPGGSGPGVLPG